MGLMEKIRNLISSRPTTPTHAYPPSPKHELRSDPLSKGRDPTLSHPRDRALDPLMIAQDSGGGDYIAPVRDDEWELYLPPTKRTTEQSSDPMFQDSWLDVDDDMNLDLPMEQLNSDSPPLAQQVSPYHSDLAQLHDSVPLLSPPSPETEMFDELAPPLILDESLDGQEFSAHDLSESEGSVFVAAHRRTNTSQRPQLSLALLPVAIPSPLSYALVYREHIDFHLNQEESEQTTSTLIDLFSRYLALVPNDLEMWQSYSEVLIETEGLEFAYNQVKSALGKTRDETGLLLMLADMSRRMCDTHTAWHYISILNDLHPNNIDVLSQLRDIQRECKFYELAENTDAHIEKLIRGQQRSGELSEEFLDPVYDHN